MQVTCCVYEDHGSFRILREMYKVKKSEHRWTVNVENFFKLATEHYPIPRMLVSNVNKSGSL